MTGKDYTWYRSEQNGANREPGDMGWRIAWAPDGFTMQAHHSQTMSTSREPVEHIVYSDGIATVSIFIEESEGEASGRKSGSQRKGGVNTFSRQQGGFWITAVGEVPLKTVERMAGSVIAGSRESNTQLP